jgi:hypothetical protein
MALLKERRVVLGIARRFSKHLLDAFCAETQGHFDQAGANLVEVILAHWNSREDIDNPGVFRKYSANGG